jgi:hypothetical protein
VSKLFTCGKLVLNEKRLDLELGVEGVGVDAADEDEVEADRVLLAIEKMSLV